MTSGNFLICQRTMPGDHRNHIEKFRKVHFHPQIWIFLKISRTSRHQKVVTRNKTSLQKVVTRNITCLQKVVTRNKPCHQKMVTRNNPWHQNLVNRNKPVLLKVKRPDGSRYVLVGPDGSRWILRTQYPSRLINTHYDPQWTIGITLNHEDLSGPMRIYLDP